MLTPDGRLMHGSIEIGDSVVMLCDEFPEHCGSRRARSGLGGTPVVIHLHVDDVDASFARAVAAGATATMPLADMFWGDRYGQFRDPFGHRWSMSTPSKAGPACRQGVCRGGRRGPQLVERDGPGPG